MENSEVLGEVLWGFVKAAARDVFASADRHGCTLCVKLARRWGASFDIPQHYPVPLGATPKDSIALLIPGRYKQHEAYFDKLAEALVERSYPVLIGKHHESAREFISLFEHCLDRQPSAFIIQPPPLGLLHRPFVQYLGESCNRIPIVCIDRPLSETIPCVIPDHREGSRKAVNRLISSRFQGLTVVYRDPRIYAIRQRLKGVRQAQEEAGRKVGQFRYFDLKESKSLIKFLRSKKRTEMPVFADNYQRGQEVCLLTEHHIWGERPIALAHFDSLDESGLKDGDFYGCAYPYEQYIAKILELLEKSLNREPIDKLLIEVPTVLVRAV